MITRFHWWIPSKQAKDCLCSPRSTSSSWQTRPQPPFRTIHWRRQAHFSPVEIRIKSSNGPRTSIASRNGTSVWCNLWRPECHARHTNSSRGCFQIWRKKRLLNSKERLVSSHSKAVGKRAPYWCKQPISTPNFHIIRGTWGPAPTIRGQYSAITLWMPLKICVLQATHI